MGYNQIIKQPNGLFCVYSPRLVDVIQYDVTPEEIIQKRIEEAEKQIRASVEKEIKKIESRDENDCYSINFEKLCKFVMEDHGKDYSKGIKEYYNKHKD